MDLWIRSVVHFTFDDAITYTHIGTHPLFHKVSVAATTGVIIFFAFGPGCIAWFVIAEIFPLYARDMAMSV